MIPEQTLEQLNSHFAIAGVLAFHQMPSGLIFADITTPLAKATVYLQGAHITAWQPTGQQPVIFLSRKSDFVPGKPIRGGVPIAFPWFAADQNLTRFEGKPGPQHGFARIQNWTLAFAAMAGEELHLTYTLAPTEMSRQLGFDEFRLAMQFIIGRTLTMRLTVANDAATPLVFEEAMHTYYHVGDVHETTLYGLEKTAFIDKADGMKSKPASNEPLKFTGTTDRVYPDTAATCVIHDDLNKRRISVEKTNSNTTVVFNPWRELPDLGPDEWHEMLAVETVNAAANKVTLAHGKTHTMQAHISVETAKA
jgi:glucose-6-phosphate 1-epimerase